MSPLCPLTIESMDTALIALINDWKQKCLIMYTYSIVEPAGANLFKVNT